MCASVVLSLEMLSKRIERAECLREIMIFSYCVISRVRTERSDYARQGEGSALRLFNRVGLNLIEYKFDCSRSEGFARRNYTG